MADLDERVTRLEERSDAHTRMMEQVLTGMSDLRSSMDALRIELRAEIAELRSELRAEIAELRSELRGEIAGLRNEMTAFRADIRQDIADLRTSMDRHFTWLVGIQVAGLVAVIGALVGAYFR